MTHFNIRSFLARLLVLGFILSPLSSCTDQGCIEADDFGEYEQQILTIPANATSESCTYFPDKLLNDAEQGSGLKQCFTNGSVSIVDENNATQTAASGGCSGFTSVTFRNICVENCRQKCIASAGTGASGAEPSWIATSKKRVGQNIGVTVVPGSEIYIRAIGNVVLGGDLSQPLFTRSTNYGLQAQTSNFGNDFFDLPKDITKNVQFSGRWSNGTVTYGGDAENSSTAERQRAFNGARRLVAYILPHPEGYSFDIKNATDEISGTRGTPLFADTKLWQCAYSNGGQKTQSSCSSLSYNVINGYSYTDNGLAQIKYGIDSGSQKDNLGKIGGAIRWNNDGLQPYSYDPFGAITCVNCSGPPNSQDGGIVGSIASTRRITNNENYAVRMSFKNLSGSASCNISLNYKILSSRPGDGYGGTRIEVAASVIPVNGAGWSSYVDLEAKDQIEFASDAATSGAANCGTMIAYRLHKLHDIQIEKSGFVSFTTLGLSGASTACSLKGRIINRGDIVGSSTGAAINGGNRIDVANDNGNVFSAVNFDGDFYEYDPFGAMTPSDPLANLTVPPSESPAIGTAFSKNWSGKFFVRKGQVIRLAPDSWEGTWATGSSGGETRECGVGMVMKVGGTNNSGNQVDDRPAFLCRGNASEQISNPSCLQGPLVNGLPTCQAYSKTCGYNISGTAPDTQAHFCPNPSCQVSGPADSCAVSTTPAVTIAQCQACAQAKADAANPAINPPTIGMVLDQCYDLENYYGKVANIPSGTTTGMDTATLSSTQIVKGLAKLPAFNGSYGSFINLAYTGTNEGASYGNNKIYRLKAPLSSSVDGRVLFLLIDNDSFNQSMVTNYSNNGSTTSNYDGRNGYKIDLSGRQEFKDGKWLEVVLCKEPNPNPATADDNTYSCSSSAMPDYVDSIQPRVVELNSPVAAGDSPVSRTFYEFNTQGSLTRISNLAGGMGPEPNSASGLSQTSVGDNFYRHSYDGTLSGGTTAQNTAEEKAKRISRVRLTFKIKDPDIGNCNTNAPVMGQSTCNIGFCGLRTENKFYDSNVAGAAGSICLANEPVNAETSGCKKQFFCANLYYNNSGQYQVVVKVKNKTSTLSNIVDSVVSPVIEIMDGTKDRKVIGQTERLYVQIVGDNRFQAIVQIMVIMMITFYGVGYLMGVSEFSQGEIVARIIKIGIIYLFIGPNGWEWFERFFVQLFKNGTDWLTFLMASAFDKSTELQNAIDNNDFYDKSILFGSIDKVFGLFFNPVVQKKISALLFASIFGVVYLYIIYLGFFLYVYAVANAVLLYLTAQIFISILFVVGPLFFIMLLFKQTQESFDKWLSELIGFSLQQVFLLTTLAFFSMMMYEIIKMALGYRICWDDVWVINTYVTRIKLLSFWTIASLPPKMNLQSDVANVGNPEGIPSIFSILFIWVIASLMQKFIDFMTNLGGSIAGSLQVSSLGSGLKAASSAMYGAAKSAGWQKFGGNKLLGATQSADRFLFNSGKKADDDRKKTEEQKTKDRANTSSMMKAGDKAVDEHKRTNASGLAAMSKKEQEDALKQVREDAMKKKGSDMGLGDKDIDKLMKRKGELQGDSLFEVAKNAWKDRKIMGTSLGGRKVDTSLTGSQLRDATSKMTNDDDKKAVAEKIRSGEMEVKVSRGDRGMEALGKAGTKMMEGKLLSAGSALATASKHGLASLGGKVAYPITGTAGFVANRFKGAKELAKDLIGTSDYAKAQSKLEESGDITKEKFGAKWTRSAGEKNMIRDEVKSMRDETRQGQKSEVSSTADAFVGRVTGTKTNAEVAQEHQKALANSKTRNPASENHDDGDNNV